MICQMAKFSIKNTLTFFPIYPVSSCSSLIPASRGSSEGATNPAGNSKHMRPIGGRKFFITTRQGSDPLLFKIGIISIPLHLSLTFNVLCITSHV